MRKVDRYIGVPLCLAASFFARLGRLFRGAPKQPPKRILFIELAEIGGLVVAYPSLAHAKKMYPEAELYFLTFAGGKGILDLMDDVIPRENQVIIRPNGLFRFLLDAVKTVFTIRRLGIDTIVNMEAFARFSALLAFASGARRRVGFYRFFDEGHYIGELVTHKVIYSPHVHAARTFISLVEAVGEEPDAEPRCKRHLNNIPLVLPVVESSPWDRQAIDNKMRELYPGLNDDHILVILNPNSSDLITIRRWPLEYFQVFGQGMLQHEKVLLVLTGTKEERPQAEEVAAMFNSDRVLNMAGATTLAELVHLYNRCHLLITNDSGPAHFASLTDLPVLVLFGPEKPGVYGPLGSNIEIVYLDFACSPCVSAYNQKRSPCHDSQCIKQITPQSMLARAREKLGLSDKE